MPTGDPTPPFVIPTRISCHAALLDMMLKPSLIDFRE
jgi:hypothetical protein